jgi:hypothetical protein
LIPMQPPSQRPRIGFWLGVFGVFVAAFSVVAIAVAVSVVILSRKSGDAAGTSAARTTQTSAGPTFNQPIQTYTPPAPKQPIQTSAEPALNEQETIYVRTLAAGRPPEVPPIVPLPGRTAWQLAQLGEAIADDVRHGADTVAEQGYIDPSYGHGSLTSRQVSFLLVQAVWVFAPDFARYYYTCGTGWECRPPWPPEAVMTPWNTPGIPPFVRRCPAGSCDDPPPPLAYPPTPGRAH